MQLCQGSRRSVCLLFQPAPPPLGSAQSWVAARALLVARESEELRFQTVYIRDGKPVKLDGLADAIRAARTAVHR
jgi:hypothetical protein